MGKLEEYEVMKLLGKGSFGSVYCVRRLADRSLHVMKKISIHNMPAKERTATEQLCIVMTYCEGGDLATVIEKRRMRAFPENELGDFGIAKVLEGTLEMAKTVIGTPYYMSPELFRNQPYSFKSDIWSLGCVLYEIVSLRHAFEARDMNSLVQKILRASYGTVMKSILMVDSSLSQGRFLPQSPRFAARVALANLLICLQELRSLLKSMLSLSPQSRPRIVWNNKRGNLVLTSRRSHMDQIQVNHLKTHLSAQRSPGEVELNDGNKPIPPQPDQKAEQMLAQVAPQSLLEPSLSNVKSQKPTPNSLPSAADADRIRIEEKEKDRVKRAQEQRELRAKRMQQVIAKASMLPACSSPAGSSQGRSRTHERVAGESKISCF
eukprot:766383-Hanusia_phi.AAC.3